MRRAAALAACLTMAAGAIPAAAAQGGSSGAASGATSPAAAAGRVLPDRPPDVARVPAPLRAGVNESLRRLVAAAKRNPALERPVGFDVEWAPHAGAAASPAGHGPVALTSSAFLHAHARQRGTRAGSRPAPGGASYTVHANAIEPALAGDAWGEKDERGRPLFLEPVREGSAGGFARYRSGVVVLTRVARPLWVPVSRERAIRAEIRGKRAFNAQTGNATAQLRPQFSDSALREWRRYRPQREAAFRNAYEQAKKRDPAYAERLRQSHLKMEAEYEKQLRATAAQMPAIERTGEDIRRREEGCIRLLEDHLASLSPAERAAPAAISVALDAWAHRNALAWSRGCSQVAAPAGRDTRLIVEPNPDFFDRSQPPSAIQLIVVGTELLDASSSATARRFTEQVFPRIMDGSDWQALAALLSGR